jgi:hypothetical protein
MSAFNAMRVLRNEIEARLNQNEDYRAFKALENALREMSRAPQAKTAEFGAFARAAATPVAMPLAPASAQPEANSPPALQEEEAFKFGKTA